MAAAVKGLMARSQKVRLCAVMTGATMFQVIHRLMMPSSRVIMGPARIMRALPPRVNCMPWLLVSPPKSSRTIVCWPPPSLRPTSACPISWDRMATKPAMTNRAG